MKNLLTAMAKTFALSIIAVAVLTLSQGLAKADTITVIFGGVTAGNTFNYSISQDAGGRIEPGAVVPVGTTPFNSAGTDVADYFTIYDFVGFVPGSNLQPAGWMFKADLVGPTDSNVNPGDSAAIVNLTWYRTGATIVGPINIAGFSAQSTFNAVNVGGFFTSEDTVNGGATDGRTSAAIGPMTVPSAVPEPASMLLLGTGLIGAAGALRRRFGQPSSN